MRLKWKLPQLNTFAIILSIIVLVTALTWIVPSGAYDRMDVDGRQVVVAGTYHAVEANPQGIFDVLQAPIHGFENTALVIVFLLVIGGVLAVVEKTGAITAGIKEASRFFTKHPQFKFLFIPLGVILFSLCGATFGMCEEDVEMIMKEEYVMTGSDGAGMMLDGAGIPHPRYYGTFPRVIAHYGRDRGLFSLEKAVHKMTGMPSARIGLADRGVLKEGLWADLVLFDYEELEDTPTYTDPKRACKGIKRVYVNGVLTAKDGVHTGAKAGKVIRKGR